MLPANISELGYEAYLLVQVEGNTRSDTKTISVTNTVNVSITQTQVREYVEVLAVNEGITNVGVDLSAACTSYLDVALQNLKVALGPTECDTDCPVAVDVVTYFREELVGSLVVCVTYLRLPIRIVPPMYP